MTLYHLPTAYCTVYDPFCRQFSSVQFWFPLSHRPFIYAPQWLLLPGDIGTIVWPPPCPSMPGAFRTSGPFFGDVTFKCTIPEGGGEVNDHIQEFNLGTSVWLGCLIDYTAIGYARLIAHSDRKRRGIWGHGNILGRLAEDVLIKKSLCQVLSFCK